MTTFGKICEGNDTYMCDSCNKTFKAKEIKLEKAATNINILTHITPFKFIDKNGIVITSNMGAKEGDKILVCPYCNEAHPFGMDII